MEPMILTKITHGAYDFNQNNPEPMILTKITYRAYDFNKNKTKK